MTIADLEETRKKLREAGVKALHASQLYRTLVGNAERPYLSDHAVETFAEQAADYAWDAYRLLRESGLIPQNG